MILFSRRKYNVNSTFAYRIIHTDCDSNHETCDLVFSVVDLWYTGYTDSPEQMFILSITKCRMFINSS